MQVTVEVLSGLERKMTVKVPGTNVQHEIEKRLKDLVPRVKIDGFRPGKVPLNVVRQRYEDSLRREVISEVIGSTYQEAIQQEKLAPAGLPKINLSVVVPGQALEYEAAFEVYPTITLHELNDVEVESLKVELDDQDIDTMLEKLRKQQAEWVETDQPAEIGNRAVVDFESKIGDELFEGGTGKGVTVELGSGAAIPDFEKGLIGVKAGQEEVSFTIQFPENYHRKDLAGKVSTVVAKVHKVLVAQLPELNEDFAKKLGIAEGGLEQLRKDIAVNLSRELENSTKAQLKGQILAKLLELNPIEVPQVLLNEEVKNLQQQHHAEQGHQHAHAHDHGSSSEEKEHFEKTAKQRVGLGLIFAEIIRAHHIKVDPDKITARLEQMAGPYNDAQSVIDWYRNNKEQMAQIEALVIEEQIVDLLTTQVKLKETVKTYREIANLNQKQDVKPHDH